VCTSGALTARSLSPRVVWWCSRLGLGSAVDKVWWRRRHEHRGGKGSMPNKVVAVGAHLRIMSTVRGGGDEASGSMLFQGGRGTPVVGDKGD
jgi:hypothetical protein